MDNKNTSNTVDVAKSKGSGCLSPKPIIGGGISIKIEPNRKDNKNGD